jgi:2'-5' RNA ligase
MSSGATARLFVAVGLPAGVGGRLSEWARGVAAAARAAGLSPHALKLVHEDSMHLTLCFLGNRPVGEIDALSDALAGCTRSARELSLGAPLRLPPRRPQALAVEIQDRDGWLAQTQVRVSERLEAVSGWSPERRRFRPHVTVARMRAAARPRVRDKDRRRAGEASEIGSRLDGEWALPPTPRLSFVPEVIVLYRSRLAAEGASYEKLADCRLTGA